MKKIQKWNKPAVRVFDANEQSNPEDPGGTWQAFDAKIEQAERDELAKMQAKEKLISKFFESKRKMELEGKDVMHLSWGEAHELNDILSKTKYYTPDTQRIAKAMEDNDLIDNDDYHRVCLGMIKMSLEILPEIQPRFPEDVPKLIPLFQKLATKIKQEMEQQQKVPKRKPEEIRDETPVHIQNAYYVLKSHGDTVEGFASTNILDSHNQILPVSTLKQALPGYLESSAILLQHGHIPVARLISYDWRKINDDTEGLYIKAKLLQQHKSSIQKMIRNGDLTGFSVAGTCNLVDECQGNSCYKNITNFRLDEISLVDTPANKLCTVEAS